MEREKEKHRELIIRFLVGHSKPFEVEPRIYLKTFLKNENEKEKQENNKNRIENWKKKMNI